MRNSKKGQEKKSIYLFEQVNVIIALATKYSQTRFVIFADNDRHLQNGNQGLLKANETCKLIQDRSTRLWRLNLAI